MRSLLSVLIVLVAAPGFAQEAEEQIFAVLVDGKRVGYERQTTQRTPEGLKRVSHALIRLSLLGAPGEQKIDTIGIYSADGRQPRRISTQIAGVGAPVQIDLRIARGFVEIASNLPGAPPKRRLPWKGSYWVLGDLALPHGIQALRQLTARSGKATVMGLDFLDSQVRPTPVLRGKPERIVVRGKPTLCDVFRVESGERSFQVLAKAGTNELMEIRVPAQKAVFRLSDRTALQGLGTFDALSRAFALSNVRFAEPLNLERVRAKVRVAVSLEKPLAARLNLPYQTFKGSIKGNVIEGEFDCRMFRYDGKDAPPFTGSAPADASLARFLKSEPRVESDHPEIVSLAREITAGSATTWEAVQKIGAWIRQNIRYSITGAGALQCLREKQGDCGPHTWLTIALCRAVGIPARITGGAIYSDLFGGSYGQHYWTLVWMGPSGWVPIDTTTGEVGTLSPAHLTLWELGGIQSLYVRVLDYSPKTNPGAGGAGLTSARHKLAPSAGEKEHWTFMIEGKEIGAQTATCLRADERTSEWTCGLALDSGGQKVETETTFTISAEGVPSRFRLHAKVSGSEQQVELTFGARKAQARIQLGGSPVSREVEWAGKEMLLPNNNMTCLSLITRVLRLEPGASATLQVFSPEALRSLAITFTAEPRTETITVAGAATECVVANLSPIPGRLHVRRSDGALMRFEVPQAKLVIHRRE